MTHYRARAKSRAHQENETKHFNTIHFEIMKKKTINYIIAAVAVVAVCVVAVAAVGAGVFLLPLLGGAFTAAAK